MKEFNVSQPTVSRALKEPESHFLGDVGRLRNRCIEP